MRNTGRVAVLLGTCILAAAEVSPDAYEATRARPLFSPTRRPPPPVPVVARPPPAEPQPVPPPAPPSLALSGVVLGPGISVALLIRPGSDVATRVALGARIDGWRVSEIRPRAVVLTLGDRNVTVSLPEPAH